MDRDEQMARDAKRISEARQRAGLNWWRPKVGSNIVRILPHWSKGVGALFYKSIRRHFGIGPENGNIICRKTDGKDQDCPICDYVQELRNSGKKEDATAASDMGSKERFVVNVIDRNNPQDGVQIWEMGVMLFNDILALFLDREWGKIDSLTEGRYVKVKRTGEGKFDTRYFPTPAPNITKVDPAVMKKAHNLDEIFKTPTVDEVFGMLEGEEPEPEKEEDVSEFLGPEEEAADIGKDEKVADEEVPAAEEVVEEEEVLTIPMDDVEEKKPAPAEKAADKEKAKEEKGPKSSPDRAKEMARMRAKLKKKS